MAGSKGTIFEGGVRTPAFINGGFLPDGMRGKTLSGKATIWDYYGTFLSLAGVSNPTGDDNPKSPAAPDTFNQWPYWSGQVSESPREEVLLDHLMYSQDFTACLYGGMVQSMPCNGSGSLISGDYKLVVGEIGYAEWYGQFTPNQSFTPAMHNISQCSAEKPCLFNLTADKVESNDLSQQRPGDVEEMLQRYHSFDSHWHPPSDPPADDIEKYCEVALQNGGFAAPWRDGSDRFV